jgi:hypothetical protein
MSGSPDRRLFREFAGKTTPMFAIANRRRVAHRPSVAAHADLGRVGRGTWCFGKGTPHRWAVVPPPHDYQRGQA